MDTNFRKDYFPLVKGRAEKDMVAAFCEKNKESALKTKPRVSFCFCCVGGYGDRKLLTVRFDLGI